MTSDIKLNGDTHFCSAYCIFNKVVSACPHFYYLPTSWAPFVHLGDTPLRQTMSMSSKLHAQTTSRCPEMNATTLLHNMYVHWCIKSLSINVSCFMLFRSVQHTSGIVTGQSGAKSQEIETYLSSRSKGALGMYTSFRSNLFHFHAICGEIWSNNWLVPSSLELVPSLENLGSLLYVIWLPTRLKPFIDTMHWIWVYF